MPLNSFVQKELECPVCMERFTSPRMLPCQHTFCEHCLEELLEGTTLRCPECRQSHTVPSEGVRTFPLNVVIKRLLDNAAIYVQMSGLRREMALAQQPDSRRELATVVQSRQNVPDAASVRGTEEYEDIQIAETVKPEARIYLEAGNQPSRELRGTLCLGMVWQKVWKIPQMIARSDPIQKSSLIFGAIYALLALGKVIGGSLELSSPCYLEKQIAVYLIVKSSFALLFWVAYFVLYFLREIKRSTLNPCVRIYVTLEFMLLLAWLAVGTVWTFVLREEIKVQCLRIDATWSTMFLDFACFTVVADWTGTVLFICFVLYIACTPQDTEPDHIENISKRVMEAFNADLPDEISVDKGENVTCIRRHRDGYVTIRKEDGRTGKIPKKHLMPDDTDNRHVI